MVAVSVLPNEKWIRSPLLSDGRVRPVTRMHHGVVSEGEEHGSNRSDERVVVTAGKISSADRAGKQRVADEQILAGLAFLSDLQTDAAGAMAGRVMGPRFV